jgi:hypothetical protein
VLREQVYLLQEELLDQLAEIHIAELEMVEK